MLVEKIEKMLNMDTGSYWLFKKKFRKEYVP